MVENKVRTVPDHADRHHHFKNLADALGGHGDFTDAEIGLDGVSRGIVPDLLFDRFERQRLHGLDSMYGFHQHALAFAFRLIKFVKTALKRFDEAGDHQSHQERESQDNQCQLHAVKQQERNENAQSEHIENREKKIAGEKSPDFFRLLHVFQKNSGRNPFKKVHGETHQMSESLGGGRDVDFIRCEQQQITAHIIDQSVEKHRQQDSDSQHIQCIICLIDQHLVYDNLEKQRHDQGEHRQHRHHQGDFTEYAFVLDEFRNEPAQGKRL